MEVKLEQLIRTRNNEVTSLDFDKISNYLLTFDSG